MRYVSQNEITSLEGFEQYLQKFSYPFLDFNNSFADFQHIEYSGCGSNMSVGSWSFTERLREGYPQFRHYKISSEDVAKLNLPKQIKGELFDLNEESNLEFKFKERKFLDEYLSKQSLENIAKIQEKFTDSQRTEDEKWKKFVNESKPIQKALKMVEDTQLKTLNLTSVGFAIGVMYYEKITGVTISFAGWLN